MPVCRINLGLIYTVQHLQKLYLYGASSITSLWKPVGYAVLKATMLLGCGKLFTNAVPFKSALPCLGCWTPSSFVITGSSLVTLLLQEQVDSRSCFVRRGLLTSPAEGMKLFLTAKSSRPVILLIISVNTCLNKHWSLVHLCATHTCETKETLGKDMCQKPFYCF